MDATIYESKLDEYLLDIATKAGLQNGMLLNSEDVDRKWDTYAEPFLADAVKEFNSYPEYVLACAGYLGMAVAHLWDKDWEKHADEPYSFFQGARGFDDMDDYINENILKDNEFSVKAMQDCAYAAYHFLMRYKLEPGSIAAYHCFVATVSSMYRLGAAIKLQRMGYKLEKVEL